MDISPPFFIQETRSAISLKEPQRTSAFSVRVDASPAVSRSGWRRARREESALLATSSHLSFNIKSASSDWAPDYFAGDYENALKKIDLQLQEFSFSDSAVYINVYLNLRLKRANCQAFLGRYAEALESYQTYQQIVRDWEQFFIPDQKISLLTALTSFLDQPNRPLPVMDDPKSTTVWRLFLAAYRPFDTTAPLAPFSISDDPLDPEFSAAQRLFQEGRYEETIELLHRHIAKDIGYINDSHLLLSACYALKGDYESALQHGSVARDEEPRLQDALIHYLVGDSQKAKSQLAEVFAREDLIEAELACRLLLHTTLFDSPVRQEELFYREFFQWIELLHPNQKLSDEWARKALAFFQKALHSPELGKRGDELCNQDYCHLFIAEAYFHLGNAKQAANEISQLCDPKLIRQLRIICSTACLASDHPKALSLLTQERDENYLRLSALLQKALGENPRFEENSADSFFRRGDYEWILAHPTEEGESYRAASLALLGRFTESIDLYTQLIQQTADPNLYMERAIVFLLQGKREAALADLTQAADTQYAKYFDWTRIDYLPIAPWLIEWLCL